MKTGGVIACMLALVLVAFSFPLSLPTAHALSTGNRVYVDESSPISDAQGTTFSITVRMDLASDQSINGYDVRLNYTTSTGRPILATTADISNSVFGSAAYLVADCVNGIVYPPNAGKCASDDYRTGLVHVAVGIFQNVLSGPITGGVLFSVGFSVKGNGTSLFTIDRANLLNPGAGFPSNPQYVPVITQGGVFGNRGIATFFNFATSIPSLSPSPLPTVPVNFDASLSFNPDNSNPITKYSWNFGDLQNKTLTTATTQHIYNSPGTYRVSLNASTTSAWSIITRSVVVLPALGSLSITVKANGGVLPTDVLVQLFNVSQGSPGSSPFVSRTTSLNSVNFTGLLPGMYEAKFSAPGVINSSRTESVAPGWPTLDAVYLDLVPKPPDYSGIIFLGSLTAAVAVFLAFATFRWRRTRRDRSSRSRRLKSARARS